MDAKEFAKLKKQWKDETSAGRSPVIAGNSPAYRQIIAAGKNALPHIFADLQEHGPDLWFMALNLITRENPVSADDRGDLEKMTVAWLAWAKEHGYLSE
jgi:hypothetical protein